MTIAMAWLAGKVGQVWAEVIGLCVLALLIAAPFLYTWHAGKASCESAHTQQALKVQAQTLGQLIGAVSRGNEAVGDYVLRRGASTVLYQTIIKEVPRVTTVFKRAPDAAPEPLPVCVFTRGFVRVWNRATEAGADAGSVPAATGGAESAAAGTGAAGQPDDTELFDSGVQQGELLSNHVANADGCTAARHWHDAVIDWDRRTYGEVR